MDGRGIEEGLTPGQLAKAQRIFEVMKKAADADLWRIACLMAGKADDQRLGRTESEVRDRGLRIGAKAAETAVQGRKKGGTKGAASSVPSAEAMPDSSSGGRRRSGASRVPSACPRRPLVQKTGAGHSRRGNA